MGLFLLEEDKNNSFQGVVDHTSWDSEHFQKEKQMVDERIRDDVYQKNQYNAGNVRKLGG